MLGFYLTLIDDDDGKSIFEELDIKYKQDMYSVAYSILHNVGALDIVYYYSNDCGYVGSGTKIDCEIIETNKKQAVLHYSGVDKNGKITEVDDYWMVI